VGGTEVDHWRIPLDDLLARPDFPGVEAVDHARAELERTVRDACADDPWLDRHPVEVC
jgi:hypothetical protein